MWLEIGVCRGCGGGEEDVVLDVGVFVDVMMMCCECGCTKISSRKRVQQVNAHIHKWDHCIFCREPTQKRTGEKPAHLLVFLTVSDSLQLIGMATPVFM